MCVYAYIYIHIIYHIYILYILYIIHYIMYYIYNIYNIYMIYISIFGATNSSMKLGVYWRLPFAGSEMLISACRTTGVWSCVGEIPTLSTSKGFCRCEIWINKIDGRRASFGWNAEQTGDLLWVSYHVHQHWRSFEDIHNWIRSISCICTQNMPRSFAMVAKRVPRSTYVSGGISKTLLYLCWIRKEESNTYDLYIHTHGGCSIHPRW